MGRKPSRWANLPPGMRARPRGQKVHYYLDTGEKPRREIPLGSDYIAAVSKWAELTSKPAPAADAPVTFLDVVDGRGKVIGYRKEAIPKKASRTQQDNEAELDWLLKFFGYPPAPLEGIEPVHIQQYLDWRVEAAKELAQEKNAARRKAGRPELPIDPEIGHVRANREKALFSHIWNYARRKGLTKLPNPCAGIKGFGEDGRDVVPDVELVARVQAEADQPLQFAMRLADIVGQRPGDVLRVSETDIEGAIPGGVLKVRQGKTQTKLRIVIEGALADLLREIREYKREIARERAEANKPAVHTLKLLVREDGQPLTAGMLRSRFDDARERAGVKKDLFQFRDYRAKVATETDEAAGTRAAQAMLGHTTEGMTATYIRHKVGKKVRPIK